MALEPESMSDALARGDGSVRFAATAGEENGPYFPGKYLIERGEAVFPAQRLSVFGKTITAHFTEPLAEGDVVRFPGN